MFFCACYRSNFQGLLTYMPADTPLDPESTPSCSIDCTLRHHHDGERPHGPSLASTKVCTVWIDGELLSVVGVRIVPLDVFMAGIKVYI